MTSSVVFALREIVMCAHKIATRPYLGGDEVFKAKLSKQLKVFIPLITRIQLFLLVRFLLLL